MYQIKEFTVAQEQRSDTTDALRPELLEILHESAELPDSEKQEILAAAQRAANFDAFNKFVATADQPTDLDFLIAGLGKDANLYGIDIRNPEARKQIVAVAGQHIARLNMVRAAFTVDTPVLQVEVEKFCKSQVGKSTLYRRWKSTNFGLLTEDGLAFNPSYSTMGATLINRSRGGNLLEMTAREACYYTALTGDETQKMFTQEVPGSESARSATYVGESAITGYLRRMADNGEQTSLEFAQEIIGETRETLDRWDKQTASERLAAFSASLAAQGIIPSHTKPLPEV